MASRAVPAVFTFQPPIPVPKPNLENAKKKEDRSHRKRKHSADASVFRAISQSQFLSPLSKKGQETRKRLKAKHSSPKQLFPPTQKFGITLPALSEIYGINFVRPSEHSKLHEFFALGEMVMQLECFFRDHFPNLDLAPIRDRINLILESDLSYEQKMAELGSLLYLLDRDRLIPSLETPSYVESRALEIRIEVERLLEAHSDVFDHENEDRVPSGKTHYLLRAFSKMALTSDQKLNPGALYAIIQILDDPSTYVPRYLKPEHHAHIVAVVKQLITNPAFKTLIEAKFQIHPDLAPFIRIDLKIPKDAEVTSVEVMWDCIMALLFDVRQQDDPNCYAIGALIYATENSPYKVLAQMVEWLQVGHFAFSDSVTVPILPLVEKRLIYEKDLTQVEVPADRAVELTTFHNITSAMRLTPSPTLGNSTRSLQRTLCGLLEENDAEEQISYAQKLFYTYKHNTLIHMMLAMIEFQYTNSATRTHSSSPFSSKKQDLLNVIFSNLPTSASSKYIAQLKEAVGERLWLEDCSERHVRVGKGGIIVGPSHNRKTIKRFEGSLRSLCDVLSESRRVFLLENGKYALIESISDLQQALVRIAQEVNQQQGNRYKKSAPKTVVKIGSKKFKRSIANFCASQVNGRDISGSDLRRANLLILRQTGGQGQLVLRKVFGLSYQTVSYTANNAHQFLRNLFQKFVQMDPQTQSSTPVFLVQTTDHSFTLSPENLSLSWNGYRNFNSWVQDTVYTRALDLRRSRMPWSVSQAIINRYCKDDPDLKAQIEQEFGFQHFMTYGKFRFLFLQKIDNPKSRADFQKIFDEEVMRVRLNRGVLVEILENLNLELSREQHLKLEEEIQLRMDIAQPPHVFARRLRKILIERGLGIYSHLQLEQAICDAYDLPRPIDIGDFNWLDTHREDPAHARLIARYHFGQQRLCYFLREKETEDLEKEEDFREFQIVYPTV